MEGKQTGAATAAGHNLSPRAGLLDLHCFQLGGVNYLYFPRSARLYQLSPTAARLVTDICADASGAAGDHPFSAEERFSHLLGSLNDLLQRESALPLPAPHERRLQGGNSLQAFSVYLAQSCNMSCCYCWNRGGSFGNRPRLMSEQDAETATKQIVALAAASAEEKITVNFYGGEPLLNFSALKTITLGLREREAALGKRFRFAVDTNGCLLEGEGAEFLALHFSQIGVSLDGREEIHDRQRPKAGGDRTWRRIVRNIGNFPNRELLGLRATLTAHSDSYLDTFRHLAKLGVRRIQLEYCHEPHRDGTGGGRQLVVPLERQQREMMEFIEYYVDAISHFKEIGNIPLISNLMENIFRIRGGTRYTRPCGAGVDMVAMNCSGEIFPCIAFVDLPEFGMGRGGNSDALVLHPDLAGFQVDKEEICRDCWLRYDCAGGCHATHYQLTGGVSLPHPDYCLTMKARSEVYLHAMALMLDRCPWHLEDAGMVEEVARPRPTNAEG